MAEKTAALEVRVAELASAYSAFCIVGSYDFSRYAYSASNFESVLADLEELTRTLDAKERACEDAMVEYLDAKLAGLAPAVARVKEAYPQCGSTFGIQFADFSPSYSLPTVASLLIHSSIAEIELEVERLGHRFEEMYYVCYSDKLAEIDNQVTQWENSPYCDARKALGISFDIFSYSLAEIPAELIKAESRLEHVVSQCEQAVAEATAIEVNRLKSIAQGIENAGNCNVQQHFQDLGGEGYAILYGQPPIGVGPDYGGFADVEAELTRLQGLCAQLPQTFQNVQTGFTTEFYLQRGQTVQLHLEDVAITLPPPCEGEMTDVQKQRYPWVGETFRWRDDRIELPWDVPEGHTLCIVIEKRTGYPNLSLLDGEGNGVLSLQGAVELAEGAVTAFPNLPGGKYSLAFTLYSDRVASSVRGELFVVVSTGVPKVEATEPLQWSVQGPQDTITVPSSYTAAMSGIHTFSLMTTERGATFTVKKVIIK